MRVPDEALPKLVRIPRDLLHVGLDDLAALGLARARAALVALLADLPLIPRAADSAALVGPPAATLPCLAVLARHVGQGLRDHNAALIHDRARLRRERLKLAFLDLTALEQALAVPAARRRLEEEAALFVVGLAAPVPPAVAALLRARRSADLPTFISASTLPACLPAGHLVECLPG
jgi:hypothetical protein